MAIGVYQIRCIVNGKVYIGSAARSIASRWWQHKDDLARGRHHSQYLQRAWVKYGESAFEFLILEECSVDQCIIREQFWMDSKQAADPKFGYNLSPTAGSQLGFRHSEETKASARSRTCSPETRAKISAANQGRIKSPETRAKLSKALKGRPPSEETRRKCSETLCGRPLSEEHKKAISNGTKGKPKSPEHNKKVSEAKAGIKKGPLPEEWRRAMSIAAKGKPKSEEHRRHISESGKRRYAMLRARKHNTQLNLPFDDED